MVPLLFISSRPPILVIADLLARSVESSFLRFFFPAYFIRRSKGEREREKVRDREYANYLSLSFSPDCDPLFPLQTYSCLASYSSHSPSRFFLAHLYLLAPLFSDIFSSTFPSFLSSSALTLLLAFSSTRFLRYPPVHPPPPPSSRFLFLPTDRPPCLSFFSFADNCTSLHRSFHSPSSSIARSEQHPSLPRDRGRSPPALAFSIA